MATQLSGGSIGRVHLLDNRRLWAIWARPGRLAGICHQRPQALSNCHRDLLSSRAPRQETPGGRRLAAIVAADAVGYSRMMRDDEAGTLGLFKSTAQK